MAGARKFVNTLGAVKRPKGRTATEGYPKAAKRKYGLTEECILGNDDMHHSDLAWPTKINGRRAHRASALKLAS